MVPENRIRALNSAEVSRDGDFVLVWMTAFRRLNWSFSLDRALSWAAELDKPVVILEALRTGYPWASDRLHSFILEGMRDNLRQAQEAQVSLLSYVEREENDGSGLVEALAERAAVVVCDDFPCFFLPRMIAAASKRMEVRSEAIDSNGLYPLRATTKVFKRAVDFRRHLQKELPRYLDRFPSKNPLPGLAERKVDPSLLDSVCEQWPMATLEEFRDIPALVSTLPIDHDVPAAPQAGGPEAAAQRWSDFLADDLDRYSDDRNHPDSDSSSQISPYLHFGHLSSHQIFVDLAESEDWSPDRLEAKARGQRSGWWGMGEAAESFLDQVVTWRELGYNMTAHRDDYAAFSSLPDWARVTIGEHREDPRPELYDKEELENADTDDEIWNAAQRQLVREGRIHNYLRMLWGKKIYEWSERPEDALEIMIELNNKYALDGRNPNSYSGIFWCLGRYDRAWGPERPIFGKIRYMTSDSTRRKLKLKGYLEQYSSAADRAPAQQNLLENA